MASVHVYIELCGRKPRTASLEALGVGRRVASSLGAALYAVLPCASAPTYRDDDVIAVLGQHGADKVILIAHPSLDEPTLYRSHGHAVAEVCTMLPPNLLLLAATPGGRDLAPRLAARLGAAFFPEPTFGCGDDGTLLLSRLVFGRRFIRRLSAHDSERPVVATLTPGAHALSLGNLEAEVIVLDSTSPPAPFAEDPPTDDPGAALGHAEVVVVAGAGVDAESFQLVCALAKAMGGEIAVTRTAADRGLGCTERVVDITGRNVSPRLYLVCGAAGSDAHLAAVSPQATVIAVNRDASAPVFARAAYGMVGPIETIVPTLLETLGAAGA